MLVDAAVGLAGWVTVPVGSGGSVPDGTTVGRAVGVPCWSGADCTMELGAVNPATMPSPNRHRKRVTMSARCSLGIIAIGCHDRSVGCFARFNQPRGGPASDVRRRAGEHLAADSIVSKANRQIRVTNTLRRLKPQSPEGSSGRDAGMSSAVNALAPGRGRIRWAGRSRSQRSPLVVTIDVAARLSVMHGILRRCTGLQR